MGVVVIEGSGPQINRMQVNSRGQALVSSQSEMLKVSREEEAYVTYSSVPLTAGTSALLYLKNLSSSLSLYITKINVSFTSSPVGFVRLYRNPTTGTIISSADSATVSNLQFDSTNTANVTDYSGHDGDTITDGTIFYSEGYQSKFNLDFGGSLKLGQNNSIAISANVDAGTTAMATIEFYMQSESL